MNRCLDNKRQFLLAGATATGKSSLVQALAEHYNAAILSADSMLVYKGMDISTAKPTLEERTRVHYYGLDCVPPDQNFSVAQWLEHAQYAYLETQKKNQPLFVTGGTGLYFSTLLRGLEPTPTIDPEKRYYLEQLSLEELQHRLQAYAVTLPDMSNPRRLVRALEILESGADLPKHWMEQQRPSLLALTWERSILHQRIVQRVYQMYADGLLDETEVLLKTYPNLSRTAQQSIGTAEAIAVLNGTLTRDQAIEQTIIRTRQLARRQETYFRHQFTIQWLLVTPSDTPSLLLDKLQIAWELNC